MNVYSRYGVRGLPKVDNFCDVMTEIAKYHFLRKPASAIAEIRSGIPDCHLKFWKKMSVGAFYNIYRALQASPAKVITLLGNSVAFMNESEERINGYLCSDCTAPPLLKH